VWIITDWYRTQGYFNSGGWRATWAGEGGGTLINQNPHQLDLLQWLVGMPNRVWSACYFGKKRDIEVEDEATIYFEYPDGAVGLYMTTVSEFPGTNRLEIAGNKGKIVYENGKITVQRTTIPEEEYNADLSNRFGPIPMMDEEVIEVPAGNAAKGRIAIIENWIDAATTGAPLIVPGQEGINSLTLSNAAYLSSWNQQWVELPFDEKLFYDKLQEKKANSVYVKKTINDMNTAIEKSYH